MTHANGTKEAEGPVRISKTVARALEDIARRTMDIEMLTARRSDSLDFHDVAVWNVRHALEAAYQLGFEAGRSASTRGDER